MEFNDLDLWGDISGSENEEERKPIVCSMTTEDAFGIFEDDDEDEDDVLVLEGFESSDEEEEEEDGTTTMVDRGVEDAEDHFTMNSDNDDDSDQAPDKQKPRLRLSEEQKTIAKEIFDTYPESAVILGSAGVGKSVLIRYLKGRMGEIYSRPDKVTVVFVVTPTGIAASNVHGRTIHSYFGLRPDDVLEPDIYKVIKRLEKYNTDAIARMKDTVVLIIDEISMVEAMMFEFIENLLQLVRNNDEPFGGVQMIICGDFMQLPPIATDKGAEAQYAFETDLWKRVMKREYVLTHIFRQSGDDRYKDLLETARWGYLTPGQKALLLTRRVETQSTHSYVRVTGEDEDAHVVVAAGDDADDDDDGYDPNLTVNIHCLREPAEKDNKRGLEGLEGRTYVYEMSVVGDVKHFHGQVYTRENRIPARVELKVGAQVLLISNLSFNDNLVNGTIGVVTSFAKVSCIVVGGISKISERTLGVTEGPVLNGESIPMVKFRGQPEPMMMPRRQWTMRETVRSKNGGGGRGRKKQVTIWQVPLVLGWACTGHKSQGMTLSSVDAYLHDAFQEGQIYVILSRVKSLDGLRIHGLDMNRIRANERALRYMKRVYGKCGKLCASLDLAIESLDLHRFRLKKRARSEHSDREGWVVSDTEYDSEDEYARYTTSKKRRRRTTTTTTPTP